MNQTQQPLLPLASPVSLRQFTEPSQESDELFQSIVTVFQEIYQVNYCLLLLLEQENIQKVYSTIKSNLEQQNLLEFSRDLYQQNQINLKEGEIYSLLIQDRLISLKLKEIGQQLQIQSICLIPLQYQQFKLGVICVYSNQNNLKWAQKNTNLVRYLIYHSTLLIHQKQKSLKTKCYQELIKSINQQLNDEHITEKKLEVLLQQVSKTFEVEQILIFRIPNLQLISHLPPKCATNSQSKSTPQKAHLWQIGHLFSKFSEKENDQLNLEQIYLQKLDETQKICFSPNQLKISFYGNSCFEYCLLSLPILIKGDFFGTLVLETKQYNRCFTEEEITILEQISQQIGLAIYQILLQEQLSTKQATYQHTSEYFSNMTHELRAPLAGILGFARMLQEQIYGSLNPKQSQYVNAVLTSGEHLMTIVNDLLDLSKIEANREELLLEKLAVEDICLAALSIVQGKAEQQGLVIDLNIAKNVDFCFADQQRLKQILINLLANAIKFTEQGRVTLKVARPKNSITFSIIDTGIGITLADQAKLFQPFQQINSFLGRKHKGTGLGLALSQKLAQLHGGEITLVSEVGQGSCFTLEIPHPEF